MSGLFPHKVVTQKEGFVFIVAPSDDTDDDEVAAAAEVERILAESWVQAPSNLTPSEVRDPEEAELIYADAIQLLEEAECEEANQLLITGVIVVGELVVVNCMLAGEDIASSGDDEEEEEEDDSLEADEEDFD